MVAADAEDYNEPKQRERQQGLGQLLHQFQEPEHQDQPGDNPDVVHEYMMQELQQMGKKNLHEAHDVVRAEDILRDWWSSACWVFISLRIIVSF